jgi:hypothetical protein
MSTFSLADSATPGEILPINGHWQSCRDDCDEPHHCWLAIAVVNSDSMTATYCTDPDLYDDDHETQQVVADFQLCLKAITSRRDTLTRQLQLLDPVSGKRSWPVDRTDLPDTDYARDHYPPLHLAMVELEKLIGWRCTDDDDKAVIAAMVEVDRLRDGRIGELKAEIANLDRLIKFANCCTRRPEDYLSLSRMGKRAVRQELEKCQLRLAKCDWSDEEDGDIDSAELAHREFLLDKCILLEVLTGYFLSPS